MIELVSGIQHLISGTNLCGCKDQGWSNFQEVPVFGFD
jgi:hypothetical protein